VYRLIVPVLALSLVLTVGVAVVHEALGPWSAYWTSQFLRAQKHKGDPTLFEVQNMPLRNQADHRIWMIGRFHTKTFEMSNVSLTQEREDGTKKSAISAGKALWLDGRWWFFDATLQEFEADGTPVKQVDAAGLPSGVTRRERDLPMPDLTETPATFLNEIKDPEYLSSAELLRFIRNHDLSRARVRQLKVDLHYRLALPWITLVVTLMGIPFGIQTARKGTFAGVALSLGLFFALYLMVHLFLWLGKELYMVPWLAGWGPNLICLVVGLVLLHRIR
jgi:lipopolysaccharide export system permease protein